VEEELTASGARSDEKEGRREYQHERQEEEEEEAEVRRNKATERVVQKSMPEDYFEAGEEAGKLKLFEGGMPGSREHHVKIPGCWASESNSKGWCRVRFAASRSETSELLPTPPQAWNSHNPTVCCALQLDERLEQYYRLGVDSERAMVRC
jgi:hypothetical protein